MIGKRVDVNENESTHYLSLSDEFLDRCMEAAQVYTMLESTLPNEEMRLLDHIGDRVRAYRMEIGESRSIFARRIEVDILDILSIENGSFPLEKVIHILSRIDKVHRSNFVPMANGLLFSMRGSTYVK